jgi:hypothetical protein
MRLVEILSASKGGLWAMWKRKRALFCLLALGLTLAEATYTTSQTTQKSDVWAPLKFLIGSWEGTGRGEPGVSRVERHYQFALNAKFIEVRNKSTYEPQEKNPKGEVHEDWGMISFDKARKRFVLRQFHTEGFVNQYVSDTDLSNLVFQSESIENIPAGWRARETYKMLSNDEFIEVFELAEPGKEFHIYTENHFKRKK